MPLTTKICGLSESNQIQACINYGANMSIDENTVRKIARINFLEAFKI